MNDSYVFFNQLQSYVYHIFHKLRMNSGIDFPKQVHCEILERTFCQRISIVRCLSYIFGFTQFQEKNKIKNKIFRKYSIDYRTIRTSKCWSNSINFSSILEIVHASIFLCILVLILNACRIFLNTFSSVKF